MSTNGSLRTIVHFNGPNGATPQGDLMQASDGNIYGVTSGGGVDNLGTVFRLKGDDSHDVLHSFNNTNGASPFAGLMQASDGSLYGTTQRGGSANWGTIFRLSLPGIAANVVLTFRRSAEAMVLAWPAHASGFGLQWTTNLNPPISWTNSMSTPTLQDGLLVVTNSIADPARFYRLESP